MIKSIYCILAIPFMAVIDFWFYLCRLYSFASDIYDRHLKEREVENEQKS